MKALNIGGFEALNEAETSSDQVKVLDIGGSAQPGLVHFLISGMTGSVDNTTAFCKFAGKTYNYERFILFIGKTSYIYYTKCI